MVFGLFHNGGTNAPLTSVESEDSAKPLSVPDAPIDEVVRGYEDVIKSQIRQGILADELGYDRFSFSEHHFQFGGSEFNPNPLITQSVIASHTENINLVQIANILPWHDPIRLAEQIATLDIISDGRLQVGVGRGYQPRENEVLGQYWGGTVQDEERNRVCFEEKFEILKLALHTDNHLVSYNGEYHTIPPSHAKHHHLQEKTYLESDIAGYDVDDMMDWDDSVDYSELGHPPALSGKSFLNSVPVVPKPVQEPLPVFWTPATSDRSLKWAARNGVNQYLFLGDDERMKEAADLYHEEAKEAGWPDPRPEYDGDPFQYGWDEERQRGIGTYSPAFNTDAIDDEETIEKFKQGLEHRWDYYGAYGFVQAAFEEEVIQEGGFVDGDTIIDAGGALLGDSEYIVDQVSSLFESVGFEEASFDFYFEFPGLPAEVTEEMMRVTAEEVLPYLREEFEH